MNTAPIELTRGITSGIEMIDARTAQEFLGTQISNRNISERIVRAYHADITEGRWSFNGESIKIDSNGHLIDGQHRLSAISRTEGTGFAIPMLIIRGLPPEAQLTMDQGRKRDTGDQLSLLGMPNSANVSAAVRILLLWERGLLFRADSDAISTQVIVEWVRANPFELELIQRAISSKFTRQISAAPAVTRAAYARFSLFESESSEIFFRSLASGANLDANSPILALKNRFDRAKINRERLSRKDNLGFYVTAWNAWRRGRPLQRVATPRDGWTPEKLTPLL